MRRNSPCSPGGRAGIIPRRTRHGARACGLHARGLAAAHSPQQRRHERACVSPARGRPPAPPPAVCVMAESEGYGWLYEMATGKIRPPRTDVTGACTAAKTRKTMPCTTAIARIDCWVSEATGCVKGLAVAYHNPNQGDKTLCNTGTGADAPAASLSLASGELILTLVPRAQRALLRPSFPGGGSTCITRFVATTSAGRTWTCDARPTPRRERGSSADNANLAPASVPDALQLAPASAPQRSRPPSPQASFLCNLGPQSCHYFRWGRRQVCESGLNCREAPPAHSMPQPNAIEPSPWRGLLCQPSGWRSDGMRQPVNWNSVPWCWGVK